MCTAMVWIPIGLPNGTGTGSCGPSGSIATALVLCGAVMEHDAAAVVVPSFAHADAVRHAITDIAALSRRCGSIRSGIAGLWSIWIGGEGVRSGGGDRVAVGSAAVGGVLATALAGRVGARGFGRYGDRDLAAECMTTSKAQVVAAPETARVVPVGAAVLR